MVSARMQRKSASRWRTLRRWASHVGVGLLAGNLTFLAVELLSVLLFADEDLRGAPARVVLAIALVAGGVGGWCGARRGGPVLLQLPGDARDFALLVLWFTVSRVGELVVGFVCDPEYLVHPPSGG